MPNPRRGAPTATPQASGVQTRRVPQIKQPPKPKRRNGLARAIGRFFLLCFATTTMAVFGACLALAMNLAKLPDVSTMRGYVPHETTKIFDSHGHLLANVHGEENRVVVPLRDIPRSVQQAVIATEDTDFYTHIGINPKGIGRAVLVNVAEGSSVEGASTLTQQLARNLFLDKNKNFVRKIAEAYLAIQIERRFSKGQILEMYLNQVYWGHNAYGIEAAAQNYFGKRTKQLNLSESAMLAGILRGPEAYSPYHNRKAAKRLQRLVLDRMTIAGFIAPRTAALAAKAKLRFPGVTSFEYREGYFTSYLMKELIEHYGERAVMEGGLRVTTTLDLALQHQAERIVREGVAHNKIYNIHQAALVAIDPKTGYVKAMVGGVDYHTSKFNRAVQALRPPGSTFKPFVYLTALSAGYSPGSVVVDEPISYPDAQGNLYEPNNYDHRFRGPLTLRKALEKSVNIVAVKLGHEVGIQRVIRTARALGITSKLGENLSLPLGTSEVTPFEMAAAYAVLANDGMRNEPTLIQKITDRNGQVLEDNKPAPERVYDAQPVRMMVNMMQGVIEHGTGYAARIGRPAAGKTGTTSDARDVWFSGFTPDLATVIWMGNDDNSRLAGGSTGGEVVAPVWARFMRVALAKVPPHEFVALGDVSRATINRRTGRLANPKDKDAETEIFVPGREPAGYHPGSEVVTDAPVAPVEPTEPRVEPVDRPVRKARVRVNPRPHAQPHARPKRGHGPKVESVINTDETLLEPMPAQPVNP